MRVGVAVVFLLGLALATASDGCGGTISGGGDAAAGNRYDGEGNGGTSGTPGTGGNAGSGGLPPCTCASGMTCCGDVCADLTSDANNCGGCGVKCNDAICIDSVCR